jgi:quercetin dioxygenase-like cupin family protein
MYRWFLAALGSAAVACALTVPPATADEAGHAVLKAADLKWAPADPKQPSGVQVAVMAGDPSKPGTFVMAVKFPAGSELPSHTHSITEYGSVVSGRLLAGFGVKPDKSSAIEVGPGDFFWMKAGEHHAAWTPEETIIYITGQGPFDIHFD